MNSLFLQCTYCEPKTEGDIADSVHAAIHRRVSERVVCEDDITTNCSAFNARPCIM